MPEKTLYVEISENHKFPSETKASKSHFRSKAAAVLKGAGCGILREIITMPSTEVVLEIVLLGSESEIANLRKRIQELGFTETTKPKSKKQDIGIIND